ncbi:MAG: HAD family phosphatase [Acidobacteria bacterium]|nr:HAD family phosphatase [Acidobacteriota bacterium]
MTDRYDAILFDFDGVLVDSEPVHYACWKEVLLHFGVDLPWDVYASSCIGVADREMIQGFATNLGVNFDELWAQYPRKKELFAARNEAEVQFLPETLAVLREVAASHKIAVVSSSARMEIEPVLVRAGVRTLFGAMVCGHEAARLKPAPDPYLKAADMLGALRPLVVEDSEAGAQSGMAAGFDVLRLREAAELAGALRQRLR